MSEASKILNFKSTLTPKYARVYFRKDEIESQRNFLILMDNIRIISISRSDIDAEVESLKKNHFEADNRIVLHGDEMVNKFKYAMKNFFPEKEYFITDNPLA